MSLIDRLFLRHQAKTNSAAESYAALVGATAHDESAVDESRAMEILSAAGKSPDDLAADVAAHRQREKDRAGAADGPPAQAELRDILARQSAAAKAAEKSAADFRVQINALERERQKCEARIQVAKAAQQRLTTGAPAAAKAARNDAKQVHGAAVNAEREARQHAQDLRNERQQRQARLDSVSHDPERRDEALAALDDVGVRIAEADERVTAAGKRVADAAAQLRAAESAAVNA